MLRAAFKSVLGRKLRLLLTTISVALGVAFVAGSMILTDTLDSTFTRLFAEVDANTDVAVRGVRTVDGSFGGPADRPRVSNEVVEKVRAVPGVADVLASQEGYAQPIDPKTGKAIANGGAPTIGFNWVESPLATVQIAQGRAPQADDEVAIDTVTARKYGFTPGQSVDVLVESGRRTTTMVGTIAFGTTGNTGGAVLLAFPDAQATELLGRPGSVSNIKIAGADGVSETELRDAVAAVLPEDAEAVTGTQLREDNANEITQALGFLGTVLLVFAGVSLFVGSFIIVNTFTMLVAQRTKELALLRAIGASRRQVKQLVLVEAAAVGLAAATLGLALGAGVAAGLQVLFNKGFGLPKGSLAFEPRTFIASYAVGIFVTLFAAYGPARRAGRVPPVAAMRDDVALPTGTLRRRLISGAILVALGTAALVVGLIGAGDSTAMLVGGGAAFIFIGVALLAPVLSGPVIRLLSAPLGNKRVVTSLARRNATRNPRRTAATASALMVGLALVSAVGVLASSIVTSATELVDDSIGADYVISGPQGMPTIPPALADKVRTLDGVESVTQFRFGIGKLGDLPGEPVQGANPEGLERSIVLKMSEGSVDALSQGRLLVERGVAAENGWSVGTQLPLSLQGAPGSQTIAVGGLYEDNEFAGRFILPIDVVAAGVSRNLDGVVTVVLEPDADTAAVRTALEAATLELAPAATARDQSEYKAELRTQIEQLLAIIYGLLALAIIIAMLGIVNTLALSVIERTREIGLLRAVGTSRKQLRSTIRWEAVLVALFGATLGVALGTLFGVALVQALKDEGIGTLSMPWGTLIGCFAMAGIIGVLASVAPARRAAKMDVLRAISST